MAINIRRKKTSKSLTQKITRARAIAKQVANDLKKAAKKTKPVIKAANGVLDLEDLLSVLLDE